MSELITVCMSELQLIYVGKHWGIIFIRENDAFDPIKCDKLNDDDRLYFFFHFQG